MSAIVVCPLSKVAETVAAYKARHIVALVNRDTNLARPPSVAAANHLHVPVHDILEPTEGLVCPAEQHVSALLDFMRRWDRAAPVVIHCYAGISRSTAAAFSAYCAARPDLDEALVARRLRERSPEATPNPLVVSLADRILGRSGRMVQAVEAIGRGAEAFEGTVFALPLDE
jgi:predicted protein tyrosine phosphatase